MSYVLSVCMREGDDADRDVFESIREDISTKEQASEFAKAVAEAIENEATIVMEVGGDGLVIIPGRYVVLAALSPLDET